MIAVCTIWTNLTQPPPPPERHHHNHHQHYKHTTLCPMSIGHCPRSKKLVGSGGVPCRADLFSCFRGSCLSSFCHGSNCGTALVLVHSTLSAWRRAIFCAVLMFPGILAPGLVPGGPGPGINHAFPDQAGLVHRPRHYRGQ